MCSKRGIGCAGEDPIRVLRRFCPVKTFLQSLCQYGLGRRSAASVLPRHAPSCDRWCRVPLIWRSSESGQLRKNDLQLGAGPHVTICRVLANRLRRREGEVNYVRPLFWVGATSLPESSAGCHEPFQGSALGNQQPTSSTLRITRRTTCVARREAAFSTWSRERVREVHPDLGPGGHRNRAGLFDRLAVHGPAGADRIVVIQSRR